jgi:membrane protease YdiL (CAAX protease family)
LKREIRGALLLLSLCFGVAHYFPPHLMSRGKRLPRKPSAMAVVAPLLLVVMAAIRVEAATMGSCSIWKEDREQEREEKRKPEPVQHGRLRWP